MLRIKQFPREGVAAAVLAAVAACGIFAGPASQLKPAGYPQLIATQPLPALPERKREADAGTAYSAPRVWSRCGRGSAGTLPDDRASAGDRCLSQDGEW